MSNPTCCGKDAVWVDNGPKLKYFYCRECKKEVDDGTGLMVPNAESLAGIFGQQCQTAIQGSWQIMTKAATAWSPLWPPTSNTPPAQANATGSVPIFKHRDPSPCCKGSHVACYTDGLGWCEGCAARIPNSRA